MLITTDNIKSLSRGWSTIYGEAYQEAKAWSSALTTEVPSTTSENVYGWLAEDGKMREWLGERVIQSLAARDFVIRNKDFEYTVGVDRNDIEDDNLGIYRTKFKGMAYAAKKWPDDLVLDLLVNGQNRICHDGQSYFDVDHPVNPNRGSLGVQSNYLLSTPFSEANFEAAWLAMTTLKDESGREMGIMPNVLVVPPALTIAAKKLVNLTTVAQGGANVFYSMVNVVTIPELASKPTEWYLFDTTKAVMPLIFQLRKAPTWENMDKPSNENVFMRKKLIYGIDSRGNAGYGPYFLGLKATAAAS